MNTEDIKSKIAIGLTPEPYKTFRKEGVVDGENVLTQQGKDVFLMFLLENNKEDFAKFLKQYEN